MRKGDRVSRTEGSHSGRVRTAGNRVGAQAPRGFESHPFRQCDGYDPHPSKLLFQTEHRASVSVRPCPPVLIMSHVVLVPRAQRLRSAESLLSQHVRFPLPVSLASSTDGVHATAGNGIANVQLDCDHAPTVASRRSSPLVRLRVADATKPRMTDGALRWCRSCRAVCPTYPKVARRFLIDPGVLPRSRFS